MAARTPNPPPRASFEAEWAELNREEDERMWDENKALAPSQRLTVGRRLSEGAVSPLAAPIPGLDH